MGSRAEVASRSSSSIIYSKSDLVQTRYAPSLPSNLLSAAVCRANAAHFTWAELMTDNLATGERASESETAAGPLPKPQDSARLGRVCVWL